MRKKLLFIGLLTVPFILTSQSANEKFETFKKEFLREMQTIEIPAFGLSYKTNFENIASLPSIAKQKTFFEKSQKALQGFDKKELSKDYQIDWDIIAYESQLNLERLALEKNFRENASGPVPDSCLFNVQNGKAWYEYYLRKWVDATVTPENIYEFGMSEVHRVNGHIRKIQERSGMDSVAFYKYINEPKFFYPTVEATQAACEAARAKVMLEKRFPHLDKVPEVQIARGTNPRLSQVPAFYNNNTFFYNFFDKPFCKRQVDFLFIHEGVPGHHYQISLQNTMPRSEILNAFWFPGYTEGWAAYVEELGREIGLYATDYDFLGKWEWDIVRSVRVPLDVGINYYGWTDEEALAFWKKYVTNQDDIAMREIKRIRRWPAQVITYKHGAGKIMEWKKKMQASHGDAFDEKAFHWAVLKRGSMPPSVLEKYLDFE